MEEDIAEVVTRMLSPDRTLPQPTEEVGIQYDMRRVEGDGGEAGGGDFDFPDAQSSGLSDPGMQVDPSPGPTVLEAAGLRLITLKWLSEPLQFIACQQCKSGLNPKLALRHAKGHKIVLSPTQHAFLTDYLDASTFATEKDKLPTPPPNSAPIEGLTVSQGFKCSLCLYCAGSPGTMANHFSKAHRGAAGTCTQNSAPTAVQSYFSGTHTASFSVDTIRVGLASDDLYMAYLDQLAPQFESSTLLNPALSPDEVPPLLRVMAWDQHLSFFLQSRVTTDKLLTLTTLPTSTQGITWLGDPLRSATVAYLHHTGKLSAKSGIAVRCLLHECPRLTQHGKLWQPLVNERSIANYATTLQRWVHAILATLEKNDTSGYTFPLTPQDVLNAKALKAALQADDTEATVVKLHRFLKPLLYPLDRSVHIPGHEFSKWDEPLECVQALTNLRPDGLFKEPRDVTQMYAQIAYHIRAAILYEGHLQVANFGGDLCK
jgi:Orsellinic acid/F9775 biosynthesis cluster protein D